MKKLSLIMAVLLVLMAGLTVINNSVQAEDKEELVVSIWGFNEDLFWDNVYEPFEEKYDVEITLEVGNNASRLNKLEMRGGSKVDVIALSASFAMQGINKGLFAEINRDNIPNLEYVYDFAREPLGEKYGPAYTLASFGLVYDTEAYDEPVTSWADLWDERFKNEITMPSITTTTGPMTVYIAAQVAGVDVREDTDKAFDKLNELNPNVVKYFSKSSEMVNMFSQGEVTAAAVMDFTYGSLKDSVPTAELIEPEEGFYAVVNTINVVKNSDNKELAEKFINWFLSDEVQQANALDKIDSPVNKNVELTPEQAEGVTYGKELVENLNMVDWTYLNEVKQDWIRKWNREIVAN